METGNLNIRSLFANFLPSYPSLSVFIFFKNCIGLRIIGDHSCSAYNFPKNHFKTYSILTKTHCSCRTLRYSDSYFEPKVIVLANFIKELSASLRHSCMICSLTCSCGVYFTLLLTRWYFLGSSSKVDATGMSESCLPWSSMGFSLIIVSIKAGGSSIARSISKTMK